MKIGELAVRTGASIRSLRYYEEKGVLRPGRTSSGYRLYGDLDVQRVKHIRTLLAAGLGMDLIAEIVSCMAGERLLLAECRERLRHEHQRMSDDIDRLTRTRSLLDSLLTAPAA